MLVDNLEIPFDTAWQRIAISVSGGADSALLAYLICYEAPPGTIINVISHTRMWKTRPWQSDNSLTVYNYLANEFPELTFKRHTNFIAPELEYGSTGPTVYDEYGKFVSGDNIQQRAFAEYVCFNEDIDAYYNAVTRNPKGINLGGMKERDIDPNEHNKHLSEMIHMGRRVFHPFRFTDKSWIIKQYYQLNLTALLSITRSCEGEFENINYTNYIHGQFVPTCGNCFWCKEREWAIEQSK